MQESNNYVGKHQRVHLGKISKHKTWQSQ